MLFLPRTFLYSYSTVHAFSIVTKSNVFPMFTVISVCQFFCLFVGLPLVTPLNIVSKILSTILPSSLQVDSSTDYNGICRLLEFSELATGHFFLYMRLFA